MKIDHSVAKNINKINSVPGASTRLYELLKDPKTSSYTHIAKVLSSEFKETISSKNVKTFIDGNKMAERKLINQELKSAVEYKKFIIDYKQEIVSILDEIKEVKKDARDSKDLATYNAMIGRLFQGLEFLAKLTGDLAQSTQIDINFLIDGVNKRIANENKNRKDYLLGKTINMEKDIEDNDSYFSSELREDKKSF